MRNDSNDHNERDGRAIELVSSGWEPCPNFSAETAASPVCAGCGWLALEHEPAA